MSDPLTRLAQRVASDDFFLASAFAAYKARMDLDDAGLAARLSCPVEMLPKLALCRRPAAATFAADVQAIAARFGLDPLVLGAVVGDAR